MQRKKNCRSGDCPGVSVYRLVSGKMKDSISTTDCLNIGTHKMMDLDKSPVFENNKQALCLSIILFFKT
jgi:hypothetical protein